MIKAFAILFAFLINVSCAFAVNHSACADLSFSINKFIKIEPVTSPVLIANITNRTGNLHAPLSTKFRVITNSAEKTKLYLQAKTITEDGLQEAMFKQNGQVYIAFSNLLKQPKSQSLQNCKLGGGAKDSPGVVAYPVLSVTGPKNKYLDSENKYEIEVENGNSFVTVNVGQFVLDNSFASNDPKGFYQAILSLTEADI